MSIHDDRPPTDRAGACAGCMGHAPRREFLRTLVASGIGALVTLGASPSVARALEVGFVRGARRASDETAYPVPSADGVSIDRDNEVILARYHNVIYAFALSCPHQNTALKWLDHDGCFQCPKHKSRYQPDGEFIEGRATRGMDRYGVRRDGDKIVVELDKLFAQDKDAADWTAARIALP
ncbi:MAG TPA: Rieske (2Fe-2S) protein [Gemmatimonadaceae bacterium]|nr:Rieske (2Fe-2S) protein [Gemmatimonadaceae bacterium]